jgi:phospholipid-translocating ATPase
MIISEVVTLAIYAFSMVFLPEYFGTLRGPLLLLELNSTELLLCTVTDLSFVVSARFGWKVAVMVAVSALPLWFIKLIKSRIAPEATTKL